LLDSLLQEKMSPVKLPTLDEIQKWPEVPSISHFCSLFNVYFDLIDFEIEELETGLLSQNNTEDIFSSSSLVERLVVRLLIGCLPMYSRNIHEGNFSAYLLRLLRSKEEEAEEDGQSINFVNPFVTENVEEWSELEIRDQVRVLHQLTEIRLQAEDVKEKLKGLEADSLRVEQLGVDSDNVILWYFYGTRLYREVRPYKPKKLKKPKDGEVIEEVNEEKVLELPGWYLSCNSEPEWNDLAMKYKKSKKKQDRELYQVLNENFLPDITKMFQEKEREERLKLLMMNKRSSSRLDRKRDEMECEFASKKEEERKTELVRREEEARKEQRAKENKQKGREVRATQRSEKMMGSGKQESGLLTNRKRKEVWIQREDEPLRNELTRKKKPAMREWERLHSGEENAIKLRL